MKEQIEKALQTLRDAQAAQKSVETNFYAKCNEFVNQAHAFMELTGATSVVIGDRRQGVEIPMQGRVDWNGIVTPAVIEGYEKELLDMIQKETYRITSETDKYR